MRVARRSISGNATEMDSNCVRSTNIWNGDGETNRAAESGSSCEAKPAASAKRHSSPSTIHHAHFVPAFAHLRDHRVLFDFLAFDHDSGPFGDFAMVSYSRSIARAGNRIHELQRRIGVHCRDDDRPPAENGQMLVRMGAFARYRRARPFLQRFGRGHPWIGCSESDSPVEAGAAIQTAPKRGLTAYAKRRR